MSFKVRLARHERFVAEYLVDGNGRRAALAAGYASASAAVTAHRLLRREDVRAAIAARHEVDSERLGIERCDIIRGLLEAFKLAKELREPAAMVSAARELGRLMGYYAPDRRQVEITAGGDGRERFEAMSDAQLAAVIGGASA